MLKLNIGVLKAHRDRLNAPLIMPYISHCSVKCLVAVMDEGDRGAITAKLSTAFYGYCEPARGGLIYPTDFRRTGFAIGVSNLGSKTELCEIF